MSKLVVNEIISVDNSPVDFPDGITINGANLDVGAGGGADLSGKLEWGYYLGLFQGVTPTVPTVVGNTWTHTIAEDLSSPLGMTLPAIGYSALLPKGAYVEFTVTLPANHSDFYVTLYDNSPSLDTVFGETSADLVRITITSTGISFSTSLDGSAIPIPNSAGIYSFGLSAPIPSGAPQLHINGVSYDMPLGTYTEFLSITTAYMGDIGEQVSVTLDTVSKVHADVAYKDFYSVFSNLTTLMSPHAYGVPAAAISSNTLDSVSNEAAYKVSPKRLNEWFNEKALTQADIDNATSTKGLVSGEQLAGLGGGGGAVKTILLRDDGAGGSTWQHLISSSDLTGGDDFIFILGSSSVADLNVVCIPTEADVPELANISEIKLVVYGGTGKSGFSENFNGVGTGAQVLGTEGVVGSGCVIARKVGLDTWYLSYEVTKPSGPEVLKDWTTITAIQTQLNSGINTPLDEVRIELRNLTYNGTHDRSADLNNPKSLYLTLTESGKVLPTDMTTTVSGTYTQSSMNTYAGKSQSPTIIRQEGGDLVDSSYAAEFTKTSGQMGTFLEGYGIVDNILHGAYQLRMITWTKSLEPLDECWLIGEAGKSVSGQYRILKL